MRWEKPDIGWVKLNSDGSSRGNPSVAGSGGLIRNEKGEWICGFARRIRITTSFAAELWGLRDGILQCLNPNLCSVLIELDAKSMVDLLVNSDYSNNAISPLVDDCRSLMAQLPRVQIKHCFREANRLQMVSHGLERSKVVISFCLIVRLWTLLIFLTLMLMVCT